VAADAIAREIEAHLAEAGDPQRAEQERQYLKSALRHFGASVPATRKIAKAALTARPQFGHDELVRAVEALWARPVHECRAAAVELLELRAGLLGPGDLDLIERMLRDAQTWALVDGLAASVAGPLVERFPELAARLDAWAADEDFWLRRAALLALLLPLRAGGGDFGRFGRYAAGMLAEREFFIRKAIGWVLRDTSRRRPGLVFEWLLPRAAAASGVTVREAVKHLAPAQREAILEAYRGGRARVAKT